MEQFLDYRQVPTATEANETTEVIKGNGHVEDIKNTVEEETEERGKAWLLILS